MGGGGGGCIGDKKYPVQELCHPTVQQGHLYSEEGIVASQYCVIIPNLKSVAYSSIISRSPLHAFPINLNARIATRRHQVDLGASKSVQKEVTPTVDNGRVLQVWGLNETLGLTHPRVHEEKECV